jgi:hypothetical protein
MKATVQLTWKIRILARLILNTLHAVHWDIVGHTYFNAAILDENHAGGFVSALKTSKVPK